MVLKYVAPREHINLQGGWPTPRLHPIEALEAAAADLFSGRNIHEQLRYGPGQGEAEVRESVASWLTGEYQPDSRPISADRIVITNGASNGLATILQKFTDPGYTRSICMVEPAYHLAPAIIRDSGFVGRIRAVPEGRHGIDLESFEAILQDAETANTTTAIESIRRKVPSNGYHKIYRHVLYMVPTFSNPSGRTLSLPTRKKLVRILRRYDVLAVTDDVYDVLRWPHSGLEDGRNLQLPPRLVDVDRMMPGQGQFGNAVSNGSFSKIVAPGVRVGWMEAPVDFARELSTVGATASGGNQAHMGSLIIGRMLASGTLQRHLKNVLIPTYKRRYATMRAAIEELLYPLGVRIVSDHSNDVGIASVGGFFLYVVFPDDGLFPTTDEICQVALEDYNLRIAPGKLFTVVDDTTGDSSRLTAYIRGARLCWAWHEEKELVEGVQRLSEVLRALHSSAQKRSI